MNIEITLRDMDGRQYRRVSFDCDPDGYTLELTADRGLGIEADLLRGVCRYTPPGPGATTFGISLVATSDNMTQEVGDHVPTGAADATFLRALAAITTTSDAERLREAADRLELLEKEHRARYLDEMNSR